MKWDLFPTSPEPPFPPPQSGPGVLDTGTQSENGREIRIWKLSEVEKTDFAWKNGRSILNPLKRCNRRERGKMNWVVCTQDVGKGITEQQRRQSPSQRDSGNQRMGTEHE